MRIHSIFVLFGVGLSLLLLLFSLWQLDLICVNPVWNTRPFAENFLRQTVYNNYSDVPFQCSELCKTTIGEAYDTLLSLAVLSWFVLLISLSSLCYIQYRTIKKLRRNRNG